MKKPNSRTIAFAVLSALAAAPLAVSAAGEVKLLKANSIHTTYRGAWHRGAFDVVLASLPGTKEVFVHYKKIDGTWGDMNLAYNRPASSGKEIWRREFTTYDLDRPSEPMEFAIHYRVNGVSYWDNNNLANYTLKQDGGTILVGTNVYNGSWAPSATRTSTGKLWGYATVKNLAGAKQVKLHYTTDNWATVKIASASFSPSFYTAGYSNVPNPNTYGFEEWSYELDVGTATQVKYAIGYTVNGVQYWDNNYGQNYTTQLLP